MDLLFRNAWVLFIAVTVVNYFLIKDRVQVHIAKNPALKVGYDQILKALLIYGTIPWLIMAMGSLTGRTTSVYDYLHPRALNPIVLLFHLYIIVLWILAVRWIYVKQGAELLVRHPGIFTRRGFGNSGSPSLLMIKLGFALALLGGIVGMIISWFTDLPAFPPNNP